jgi:hypothetical protein
MTRVYVPATVVALGAYVRSGVVPSTTDRFVADDETEEAEYAALAEAAEAALGLLDEDGRRVVIVADLDDEDAAFGIDEIEAVHADTDDVDAGADPEDLPELGWFATQEIDDLLG